MPTLRAWNPVIDVAPASATEALAHFEPLLRFETDCYDVQMALMRGLDGFTVLDVRSASAYAAGHVPGAHHLPHARISATTLETFPTDTVFVVYCSGPHCNGADRAAIALARLGRPVKKMMGGITGWIDEGFTLERST
jgi:rhodanese-related sulfurtransferase